MDEGELTAALAEFTPVWEVLTPREQAKVVALLVERVEFDMEKGTVAVTFRPSGLKSLAQGKKAWKEDAA